MTQNLADIVKDLEKLRAFLLNFKLIKTLDIFEDPQKFYQKHLGKSIGKQILVQKYCKEFDTLPDYIRSLLPEHMSNLIPIIGTFTGYGQKEGTKGLLVKSGSKHIQCDYDHIISVYIKKNARGK